MDINSWLTVVAILMALMGFLIQQELKVFLMKFSKIEKSVFSLILLFFIPILLFYRGISERFPTLNSEPFAYSWGILPENIAFILFLFLFVYFLLRISFWLPRKIISTSLVRIYTEILEESPSSFWKVFLKYETCYSIEKNWVTFEDLIFHPAFLESSLNFSNAKNVLKKSVAIGRYHEKKIQIYQQLIDDNQAQKFFNIFNAYDESSNVIEHWPEFRHLFLNEVILHEAIDKYPNLLYSIWSCFDNEQDFHQVFSGFLEDRRSAYYAEIKSHRNSYSLLPDNPFLNIVISKNLEQSIHNGILPIFSDFVLMHLHSEFGKAKDSIYNQEHFSSKVREEEGFELPLYYHIQFIGLLYADAIKSRQDISNVSSRYTNMQSIFSNMIHQMLQNVLVTEENVRKENPTNFHWLISEIFSIQNNWLSSFNEEKHFNERSSYIFFIPFSMALCLSEIYEGLKKDKTSIEYVKQIIHYKILTEYFSYTLHDVLKSSIETAVIRRISRQFLEPILDFSLDNRFALHYNDFINGDFRNVNEDDRKILSRLLEFLKSSNMV